MKEPTFLAEPNRTQAHSHHQQRSHRGQFRPSQAGVACDRKERTDSGQTSRCDSSGKRKKPIRRQQEHRPSDDREDQQRDKAQVAPRNRKEMDCSGHHELITQLWVQIPSITDDDAHIESQCRLGKRSAAQRDGYCSSTDRIDSKSPTTHAHVQTQETAPPRIRSPWRSHRFLAVQDRPHSRIHQDSMTRSDGAPSPESRPDRLGRTLVQVCARSAEHV